MMHSSRNGVLTAETITSPMRESVCRAHRESRARRYRLRRYPASQDDDKDSEGKKQLHGFLNSLEEQRIHAVSLASFKGTACVSIQTDPFLFEDGLHLQAEFYGFIMAVVRDIGPFDPLAGGDRLYHLDLMGESDGEIPGSDGFAGRQEGSVDGGAAFSVQ